MAVVLFLIALLSGGVQVVQTDGNNVVSAVGRGVPDGLVLAHEGNGDLRGDAPEGTAVGGDVDVVPCSAVGESGLGVVSSERDVRRAGDVPCRLLATWCSRPAVQSGVVQASSCLSWLVVAKFRFRRARDALRKNGNSTSRMEGLDLFRDRGKHDPVRLATLGL